MQMLQVVQYQKTGEVSVDELPAPKVRSGGVLVRNLFSLVSAGTERMSVATAQGSILQKARLRPDLVRQVLDNYRREGLVATYNKVQDRLANYKELGYSCSGIVVESTVCEINVGDHVACAGVGYAAHAEIVSVPRNLVVKVPNEVNLDEAAFTTVCAIAMQGVRQADVRVGEQVAVIGLGLIGLLTIQLLKASGCRVIGIDVASRNFKLAVSLGCDQCVPNDNNSALEVEAFTRGYGADSVLLTAATTSNQPLELAIQCARKRGTVVVVGTVGMDIPRSPFYEKEINIRISCSYGPGRYDSDYEDRGHDYPLGFVRWTENRNMEAALDMMAQRKLNVAALITHRIPVEQALQAYDIITGKVQESYLGILIEYPATNGPSLLSRNMKLHRLEGIRPCGRAVLGFIGAGNFAQSMLLPPLMKLSPRLRGIATSKPVNAKATGKKYGFEFCATDAAEVISDGDVNLVCIASRHDSHASYVVEALRARKSVFVEKPLALNNEELEAILGAYTEAEQAGTTPLLMVGYNRRFSEPIRAIQEWFSGRTEPLAMHYRINAGFSPSTHWTQQCEQGGRIIGEGGHFVDVLQFLCGAPPTSVYAVGPADGANRYSNDNVHISMTFADGSVGTIQYLANGANAVEKEYLEVFGNSKTARLWDFKKLELAASRNKSTRSFSGNKGHAAEMKALLDAFEFGTGAPITIGSLEATSRATFAAMESRRTARVIRF
jgi:predicted dehydrogenase/threonine dehydrogenase-like Zn-dependent dehydrogenase